MLTRLRASIRVSVALPVRNGGPWLADAVRSLLEQTERAIEVVAVDDGSSDGSAALLRRFAKLDARLRVLSPGAIGLVGALQLSLEAARGRYIARMDADDIAHPERLAVQAKFLDEHPDIGLVGSRVEFLGDRRAHRGLALWADWTGSLEEPEQIALHRFVESPLVHPTVFFRRELVSRYGGYRSGPFPEDYELWLRWLEAGVRMAQTPRPLLAWREHPDRLTRTDARYSVEAFYRVKAPYLARHLAGLRPRPERFFAWGAGRATRRRIEPLLEQGVRLAGYVDIDPNKVGQRIGNLRVHGPEDVPPPGEAFVLSFVGVRGARELIRARLEGSGYRIGRDWLPCA